MADLPAHLQRLNPEQHRAVSTTTGPLLILAGAGSGKTRVLTRRVAHLLHQGTEAKQILAVTFTNKAAAEMKERVADLVGEAGSRVWVSTFHSSCCRILRRDIEVMGYTRRFAIYDDDDQLRILRDIIDAEGYDRTKVDPRQIRSRIDHHKNRMLSLDEVIAQKRSHINEPLVRVWREYDAALEASNALDFNDLIGMTVRMFTEHPAVLSKWREQFHYVMVDEYQDTNRGQYELLRLLASEHRNLAVVGDDDQSIYGFRGADISNILNFEQDYPEAMIVRLEQNYRSSGNILTLANKVVASNEGRLEKKLWTEAPRGPRVRLIQETQPRDEARTVARLVLQLHRMGHSYGDLAIIYRTNATSRVFEQALRSVRVPHRIVGGRKFTERREVRDIIAYLRLITNPVDDAAFLRIVNVPTRGIGAKTLAKLREEAGNGGMPLLRTARARGAGRTAKEKALAAFVRAIDELASGSRELPPDELVQAVVERSGYRAMLEGDRNANDEITADARSRLENLVELARDASEYTPPDGALTAADALLAWLDHLTLAAHADEVPEEGEVTLMTVHSAKGLEYPIVFVVQMVEGQFPHAKQIDTGIDEERRLAYVAFTRAMKRLFITRSAQQPTFGRQRGTPDRAQPSRFLYGLPADACEGDVPSGEPGAADEATERRARQSKLAAFIRHRQPAPPPLNGAAAEREDELTLVDIEDIDQLQRGVRIHRPKLGFGEIRHVAGGWVQVAFSGGRQQWLGAAGSHMRIVLE